MTMHPNKCPTGVYTIVGSGIPDRLLYVWESDEDLKTAKHCGPGFAIKAAKNAGRVFTTKTYATEQEALEAIRGVK